MSSSLLIKDHGPSPKETSSGQDFSTKKKEGVPMTMKVTSSAFQAGQAIPTKYTCEGADISPPLQWSGVPAGAKSLALICDDPTLPSARGYTGSVVLLAMARLPGGSEP